MAGVEPFERPSDWRGGVAGVLPRPPSTPASSSPLSGECRSPGGPGGPSCGVSPCPSSAGSSSSSRAGGSRSPGGPGGPSCGGSVPPASSISSMEVWTSASRDSTPAGGGVGHRQVRYPCQSVPNLEKARSTTASSAHFGRYAGVGSWSSSFREDHSIGNQCQSNWSRSACIQSQHAAPYVKCPFVARASCGGVRYISAVSTGSHDPEAKAPS